MAKDDTFIPPWEKPAKQIDLGEIIAYLVRSDLRTGAHRITLSTPDGQPGDQCGEASASVWIKVVEKEC